MSASAARPSPTSPIRIPVPAVVPPRRRVPAASEAPPRPPSTPPTAPPTASVQLSSAKPTSTPTAAPIRTAISAPVLVRPSQAAAVTPAPAPMPTATPIRYHSHIGASVVAQNRFPSARELAGETHATGGPMRKTFLVLAALAAALVTSLALAAVATARGGGHL